MRFLCFSLAAVLALACTRPQKPPAFAFLTKDAVFQKDSVRRFLSTVSEAQADSSKAVFRSGIDLLKNGKRAGEAVNTLLQSLCIYPLANTYYELGNAYLQTREWPKALRSFEMAEALDFTPLGNVLFKQASCYAEMDSAQKMYNYLTYAVQNGFVDRERIVNNPHFAAFKTDNNLLSVYNEAMSGNGDPEEIRWRGYLQDFKPAAFPYTVDSGAFRRMKEPKVISYDYEKFVPEMRDNKFSRDVGNEYFYVSRILQTELCSVVLYGCRSYEYEGAPVYFILASFDARGRLVDKMIAGGAKTFDENYREFTAQSADRFQIQEYKNTYEKSTDSEGFVNNKIIARSLVATHRFVIDAHGKFVAAQAS